MADMHEQPDDPVLAVLGESRARRRSAALLAAMVRSVLAVAAAVILLFGTPMEGTEIITSSGTRIVTQSQSGSMLGWMALATAMAVAAGFVVFTRAIRRRMPSPSALGKIAELSTIGRFSEALWHEDRYVQTEAEEALIAMLPRLQAGDAGLLNERQRACLHRALKPPKRQREAELALAVMRALTEIADARAVPHMSRLADEPARGAHQEAVRACAVELLPILQEKVESARLAQTLVRPSSAPDGATTLLRPLEASPSGSAHHLVRPAAPPENGS